MPVSAVKKYRWRKRMLPVLLVAYLLVATTRSGELFPIFSWNLFARIPTRAKRFHVVIKSLDGKPVENLDLFLDRTEVSKRGVSVPLTREFLRLLKSAGNCLEFLGSRAACEGDIRKMEEFVFSRNQNASYEMIRVAYNPYKLLMMGQERDRLTLAKLSYGVPAP